MNSLRFAPIFVHPWTVLVDCCLKIEEFPNKMAISSAQNSRDKPFFLTKLAGFVPQCWIFDHTRSCFVVSSLHLCLSCTVPKFHLVSLRPPSNFFIHSLSLSLPVLSKTQLPKAFSLYAGALSLWHSPRQWVYWMVRVPRSLDCTRLGTRSLLPWSKKSQLNRNSPSRW